MNGTSDDSGTPAKRLSPSQLAESIGVGRAAVYGLIRRGRLPATKVAGRIYLDPAVAIKALVRPIGQVGPTDDK
jgi:excisionase family DNA binding protein